ncbi:hypothetical protein B0H34DRAFT_793892 [Crassisporium funariophilum]|nr:hypothetical protein B0H34DRAFT_793892 [Crassisporium funariophilum]
MNAPDIDEDAIDAEALQAQIDLSMSFAQNLVSSWMQPHKIPKNPRKKDLEKELTEYMRRPPRLGVGASIPEGQSFSRETARLKGKLVGSKRAREEEELVAPKQASDNETESRATAIKKKARSDPFDVVHGKKNKKRKNNEKGNTPQDLSVELEHRTDLALVDSKNAMSIDGPIASSSTLSPNKMKKKRKEPLKSENEGIQNVHEDVPLLGHQAHAPSKDNASSLPILPSTPSSGQREVVSTPQKQLTVDVSLTTTPLLASANRKPLPLDLLKRPLLNLDGPPSDQESDDPMTGTPSSSPKKKRKRRKKKKNILIPTVADATTEEAGPALVIE